MFKIAHGEYIAPEKIEHIYESHDIVSQAFVHGDSLQATIIAIIVVDEIPFVRWAKEKGIKGKKLSEILQEKVIEKTVQKTLESYGREMGLKGFEIPKHIFLETHPFTTESGLLTPTLRLKRFEARKKYAKEISDMYQKK